jgi:hypothetical protein
MTGLGAREAKRATSTIPIVLVADPDPVGDGLAESLAHHCWRTGFLRSRVQITSVAYKLDPSTERILHENWCGRICACHECEADA